MIIAVIAMWMMKMSVNQIVNMVAVWDGGMAAVRPVDMICGVLFVGEARRAFGRIRGTHGNDMFVHMVAV